MSIDAIGNVVAGVSALAASRTELAAGDQGANTGQSSTADQLANDQAAAAAVVAISQEAQAQQQAAADQAAQDAAAAASASAVTGAVSSDWASGAPTVDNVAIQEALDALDEASRANNLQLEQDAIRSQQDQAALDQHAVQNAATAGVQRQDDILLAALNAGIRVAFGSLATPITGDPALREPGKVEVVA